MSLNIQFHRVESVTISPAKESTANGRPFWYSTIKVVSTDHRGNKVTQDIGLFSETEDGVTLKYPKED